jgi:hypothetical protein
MSDPDKILDNYDPAPVVPPTALGDRRPQPRRANHRLRGLRHAQGAARQHHHVAPDRLRQVPVRAGLPHAEVGPAA